MREGELAPFGDGAAGERLAELLGEVVAVAAENVVGLRGELERQAVQEVVHTERAAEGKDYWMGKGRIIGWGRDGLLDSDHLCLDAITVAISMESLNRV